MTQIRKLQNKVNYLSDTREFHDLESGSSSGATHVLDQTSTIMSSRTLPRCDSGLPCGAQNGKVITENVFERPPVQEGQSSTIFNNSKKVGIFISVLETGYFRDHKKRNENGIVEYADSITLLPK